MLAYLRKGEAFAELAALFGTATAWRYVSEPPAWPPEIDHLNLRTWIEA